MGRREGKGREQGKGRTMQGYILVSVLFHIQWTQHRHPCAIETLRMGHGNQTCTSHHGYGGRFAKKKKEVEKQTKCTPHSEYAYSDIATATSDIWHHDQAWPKY